MLKKVTLKDVLLNEGKSTLFMTWERLPSRCAVFFYLETSQILFFLLSLNKSDERKIKERSFQLGETSGKFKIYVEKKKEKVSNLSDREKFDIFPSVPVI